MCLSAIIFTGCEERHLDSHKARTDVKGQPRVNVLLLEDVENCVVRIKSCFSVVDAANRKELARFEKIDHPVEVTVSDAGFSILGNTLSSERIIIEPDAPNFFTLNENTYRGTLKLTLDTAEKTFDAVNIVALEPYLYGVIGAEMPSYWEMSALKAQTIAARTYCLYIKQRFGTGRDWDLKKTQANQVYHGIKAESAQVFQAVNQTKGMVLVCDQGDSNSDIFPAYYSSICGGHTESSKNVFGDSYESLAGVRCPYCKETAKPGFFSWQKFEFDKAVASDRLLKRYPALTPLGQIVDIDIADKTGYEKFSRITMVKLTGSTGRVDFVRGEDFRLAIDSTGRLIKSASFEITSKTDKWVLIKGRGFGHGVGMCQYGAQEMARKGKNETKILRYYYPGSRIKNIYEK